MAEKRKTSSARSRTSVRHLSREKMERMQEKEQKQQLDQQAQQAPPKPKREKQPPAAKPVVSRQPAPPRAPRRPAKPRPASRKEEKEKQRREEEEQRLQVIQGGKRKSHKFVGALAVVCIVALLVLTVQMVAPTGIIEASGNFFAGLGGGDGFPQELSSSTQRAAQMCGSNIAVLGDSSLILFKPNGRRIFERQHGYTNPVLCASDTRMLVYDRDGTRLRVENSSKTVGELTFDYPIVGADLGRNGTIAVVSQSKEYLCEVSLFNRSLEKTYVWRSGTRQVLRVSVSDNGRYFAVATLQVSEGEALSQVTVFDTQSTEPILEQSFAGAVVLSVDFKGNDRVTAVFDTMLSSIPLKGERTDYDFETRTLVAFSNQQKTGTALVLSRYNQSTSTECLVFDAQGKNLGGGTTQGEVLSVAMSGSHVCVLMRDHLTVFSSKGEMQKTVDSITDKTLVCTAGNGAALVGPAGIDWIKLS